MGSVCVLVFFCKPLHMIWWYAVMLDADSLNATEIFFWKYKSTLEELGGS